ncbi:MAG: zinc chelation protein SecC, partial [Cyanothece sp. SIO2G6]|nr:zinc chelation protein SecC [Cyanothece sp. SIO2G6]
MNQSTACPCGSSLTFAECCGPYINQQATAPTAAALMRSRYTAYCLGNIDYLMATHHPTRRAPDSRRTLTATANRVNWLELVVLHTEAGQPDDKTGVVEFVAIYQENRQIGQLHERSRFLKQRDRWFYLEGDLLPPLQPKRNDPCWCGSGKK